MHQFLKVDGGRVCQFFDEAPLTPLGPPQKAGPNGPEPCPALDALKDWKKRYTLASDKNDDPALRAIGAEMFDWLHSASALNDWMQQSNRHLQILPDERQSAPDLSAALLEAPWEILYDNANANANANANNRGWDGGFLAEHQSRLFIVSRRVMKATTAWQPQHGDLRMMFMAAAPDGMSDLDYEAEETAIIEATQSTSGPSALAHLVVEESGGLEFLSDRLNGHDGTFEILHLSCHGDILSPQTEERNQQGAERPVLFLETEDGHAREVSAPEMIDACQGVLPPLVFVSACRTAQRGGSDAMRAAHMRRQSGLMDAPGLTHDKNGSGRNRRDLGQDQGHPSLEAAEPYVLELVRGVPNVLGWDGSVYDRDASAFATRFYGALSRGQDVPTAAALARRDLIRQQQHGGSQDRGHDQGKGRHWHLARVYLGAKGGGALCTPGQAVRDAPPAVPAFLDSNNKIKVAGRDTFVGRRRTIQHAIATLRKSHRGLLIHGIGNLGKSSLAARLAERLIQYQTVVVVSPKEEFGSANAHAIFTELKAAVESKAAALPYGSEEARKLRDTIIQMEQDLTANPAQFEPILDSLLAGPFKKHPILLILDDFEHSLKTPTPDAPIPTPRSSLHEDIRAIFKAFAKAGVTSRLMVTCRYDFSVSDRQGGDLTHPFLERIPLPPMNARERLKQWQARERARNGERRETMATANLDGGLVQRILAASQGNPGLQEVLTQPLLRGEVESVEKALETVETFLESGTLPPSEEDVGDFFTRMTFEVYRKALNGTTRLALSVARAFSPDVPLPVPALKAAMEAVGLADPDAALEKLLALGLLDDHGEKVEGHIMAGCRHVAINPLARPLSETLSEHDQIAVAKAALPLLAEVWQDDDGDFPVDRRAVEFTEKALIAHITDGSLLDGAATKAVIFLFKLSQNAPAAIALAEPVLARCEALSHPPSALLLGHSINAASRIGAVHLQEQWLAAALERTDIEEGLSAQLKGLHADRLTRKGDLDKALTIREKEELPVYEALGDKRSIAITKGKIADILVRRGDLNTAMFIREHEMLPAFEALEDKRSIAITKGQIADILMTRGDLDTALAIREKEVLPVYEALGDKREIAVTQGKIADILVMRGDLNTALAIRERDVLPAFEALEDKREIAITKGQIADILEKQDDCDTALTIREKEELPVYEALGDKRSIAITKGQIANIYEEQGDLDAALALHLERLPIADAMQDLESLVHIRFSCAQIRLQRGDFEKGDAQIIVDELKTAFEGALKLGRPDAIGSIGILLAPILAAGGLKEVAHEVLDLSEQAFTTLGEQDGLALITTLRTEIGDRDDPDI